MAFSLQRRIGDGLPDDLLALLQSYVHAPQNQDETGWEQSGDPYSRYINSERDAP